MSNDQGKSCESGNALDDIFNLVVLDLAAITGVTRAAAFVENRLQISCMMQLKKTPAACLFYGYKKYSLLSPLPKS